MKMNPREKLIAIGVGVAAGLFMVDHFFLSPLGTRLETADRIANQNRLTIAEGEGTLRNSLNARRNWKRVSGVNVADNAPAAESQVLNHVRDWVQQSGLTLTAIKPARADKEKGFDKIAINATATGGMEQMSRFLYSVQTSDFPIRVNRIDLTARKEGTDDIVMNIELASIYGDVTQPLATVATGGGR